MTYFFSCNRFTKWSTALAALFVILTFFTVEFIAGSEEKKKEIFAYPQQVTIPKDVPSYLEVQREKDPTKGTKIILPAPLYLQSHYDGWQLFLNQVKTNGVEAIDKPWKERQGSLYPAAVYLQMGEKQGYEDCRETIKKLLKQYTQYQVYEVAVNSIHTRE